MGLFDLLSKEGRAKGAVDRAIKRVVDKHAQSGDRFAAMEKLREVATDEALYGLARRFSYNYDKTIEDEQEKEYAVDALTSAGETSVAPLRRFVLEADSLSYGLRVLERVAQSAALLAIIDEVMAKEEPGYTRDPSRKIQLLSWLGEWHAESAAEVTKRITPYLKDFDENVRFAAIDALSHRKDDGARLPLVEALVRPEEESRRLKGRIAELIAAHEWTVTEHKEAVSRIIANELPQYGMHHDKLTVPGAGKAK